MRITLYFIPFSIGNKSKFTSVSIESFMFLSITLPTRRYLGSFDTSIASNSSSSKIGSLAPAIYSTCISFLIFFVVFVKFNLLINDFWSFMWEVILRNLFFDLFTIMSASSMIFHRGDILRLRRCFRLVFVADHLFLKRVWFGCWKNVKFRYYSQLLEIRNIFKRWISLKAIFCN